LSLDSKILIVFMAKSLERSLLTVFLKKIEDIAGVRIICPYRSDLKTIEGIIDRHFQVLEKKLVQDRADITFGYMSDHYTVMLPKTCSGARYDSIKTLKGEIQARTISMHAWATVSHHLDYKQDVDIPSNLKKDFYGLSGIFYVADSLFEQFRIARSSALEPVVANAKKDEFDLKTEMNLDTMPAYLGWKLPDRKHAVDSQSISHLLGDLARSKINNYFQLSKVIDDNISWLKEYEINSPPVESRIVDGKPEFVKIRYMDVGVIRVILRHTLKTIP